MGKTLAAIALLTVVGCGSSSSKSKGDDLGMADMSTAGSDAAGPMDDLSIKADLAVGPDLSPPGCAGAPDNSPCANGGLCKSQVCEPCGAGSDAECTSAYGGPHVCVVGGCVPGDCHTNTDCPTGKICYVTRPNFCDPGCASNSDCPNGKFCNGVQQCSGCVSDDDCGAIGAGYVCDTASSTCIANVCANVGTCAVNSADYCCGSSCVFGNCCSATENTLPDAHCDTLLGVASGMAKCVNNQCSACPAVNNSIYYVDPVTGNDSTGTGDNTTANCAFRTIGRALKVLGDRPTPVTILIKSDVPVANQENQLSVGKNITIQGMMRTTVFHVKPGPYGIQLQQPGAHLTSLVIDGGNLVDEGILVTQVSPSPSPQPLIDGVTIQNMRRNGIHVRQHSKLIIGADFVCQSVGTNSNDACLQIQDQDSLVTINQTNPGLMPIKFNNSQNGVFIFSRGAMNVVGAVAGDGTGTVNFSNNVNDGILIDNNTNPASIVFDGIIASGNGVGGDERYGAGLQINDPNGVAVKLRRSTLLANVIAGVRIRGSGPELASIDLGGAPIKAGGNTDNGANTLQAAMPQSNRTGICIEEADTTVPLPARGNKFLGVDCSISTATVNELKIGKCVDLITPSPKPISDVAWLNAGSVDVTTCK